jgi:site-specific DNA recombinase
MIATAAVLATTQLVLGADAPALDGDSFARRGDATMAGDTPAIHQSLDGSRRLCNRAFSERISAYEVEDVDAVTADHGEPFDPALHADPLASKAAVGREGMSNPPMLRIGTSNLLVGPAGLEPTTSAV